MRKIISTLVGWTLATSAISICAPFAGQALHAQTVQPADNPRSEMLLGEGWQFNFVGSDPTAAHQPDQSAWQKVSVPHTWNRVGYYRSDPETHINSAEKVNKEQGVGWYYLSFSAPAMADEQRAFLEFDAASRTADVWLNGVHLGGHRNPFGRFRLDATDALNAGGANSLYVKVDNSAPELGSSTDDVFPLAGDFFVRGGLYRPVSLIVTDEVHFDMLDYGGPGVYARTESLSRNKASIALSARVTNDSASTRTAGIIASLVDADGEIAAQWRGEAELLAGESRAISGALEVADPRMWQGVDDPYLYTLRTEIVSAEGQTRDVLDQKFGIRTMELDPERGFLLNGAVYPLRGVGLHQDTELSDWAVSEEDVAQTVAIIRDMGGNAIRLAHYQHGSPIHELADRHGIVLWDEVAVVTSWTTADDQTMSPPDLLENGRLQVRDMINQNYNHASVAVWGIANEVDFGPGRPTFLGRPPENVPDPRPLLEELYAVAKQEDPFRDIALAQCCEARGQAGVPVVADTVDAVGANRYFGWYYGVPSQLGEHFDELRRLHPALPLSISEYGAGGAPNMHSDNPLGGPIDMGGRTQPEEFLSWFHEESWKELSELDYLWGVFIWNGFDFGSTVRTEGDAQDINTKGLVSYDRQIRKDAYYFYRANWSDQPTVHITGRRYVDRAYPVTDIRVYSNASVTSLSLNGRDLGEMRGCANSVCVWSDVRLAEGSNLVEAIGRFGDVERRDAITWQVDREQARAFRIDSGSVIAADAVEQFGSDAFFLDGSAGSTDQRGGRGRKAVTAEIANTDMRDIVATFREGNFRYRIPAANGRYRVTLTFVEPSADGERVFNVLANGATQLSDYSIRRAAGGALIAARESFEIDVDDGELDLHFEPVSGEALVSAVEIVPLP